MFLDFIGPIHPVSSAGNKWAITCVDYATRLKFAKAFKRKTDFYTWFPNLLMMLRTQYDVTVRVIICDNEQVFIGDIMYRFLAGLGVVVHTVHVESQHQNLAEPVQKYLKAKTRANLIRSGVPHNRWDLAYVFSAYVDNLTWHERIGATPHECFYQDGPPDLSKLQIFGSWAIVKTREAKKRVIGPFGDCAALGRFVGIGEEGGDKYRFMYDNGSISVSQHAVFMLPGSLLVPADQEALPPNPVRNVDAPFGLDNERSLFMPVNGTATSLSQQLFSRVPFLPRTDPPKQRAKAVSRELSKEELDRVQNEVNVRQLQILVDELGKPAPHPAD
jgi:hypothetical protein